MLYSMLQERKKSNASNSCAGVIRLSTGDDIPILPPHILHYSTQPISLQHSSRYNRTAQSLSIPPSSPLLPSILHSCAFSRPFPMPERPARTYLLSNLPPMVDTRYTARAEQPNHSSPRLQTASQVKRSCHMYFSNDGRQFDGEGHSNSVKVYLLLLFKFSKYQTTMTLRLTADNNLGLETSSFSGEYIQAFW